MREWWVGDPGQTIIFSTAWKKISGWKGEGQLSGQCICYACAKPSSIGCPRAWSSWAHPLAILQIFLQTKGVRSTHLIGEGRIVVLRLLSMWHRNILGNPVYASFCLSMPLSNLFLAHRMVWQKWQTVRGRRTGRLDRQV